MKLKSLVIILLSSVAILISSCERVIDLDLDEAKPVLVIEAMVTDTTATQVVRLTTSIPFTESNTFPAVSGATVTLSESDGRTYTLAEDAFSPGTYRLRNLRGKPLNTYTLLVMTGGEEYTATSAMPKPVRLDSLGIVRTQFFNEEILSVNVFYDDPPDTANFYRFIVTVNGRVSDNVYVANDDFNDGKTVSLDLGDPDDDDLKPGDLVEVEMQSIDEAVYRYFDGLSQNENRGGASTTPANPVSNLSNGALGYFNAHTSQKSFIKVGEK